MSVDRKVNKFVPTKAIKVEIKNRFGPGSMVIVTREDGKEFLLATRYIKYKNGLLILKTYSKDNLPVTIEIAEDYIFDNRLTKNV